MKLKRKIVGLLSACAIIVPTLSSITSCTFTRGTYTCPTVSFLGSPTMNPAEGVSEMTLDGFKFSRSLMDGEHVEVSVKDPATGNDAKKVTATPSYRTGSNKMSIKFNLSVDDQFVNQSEKFLLTFAFTYKDKSDTYTGLDRVFTFNYSARWNRNSISGDLQNYDITWDGSTGNFVVDNLYLGRTIETEKGEDLVVSVVNGDVTFARWEQNTETKELKIFFSTPLNDEYYSYDKPFDLSFDFQLNGKTKQELITKLGGNAHYDRHQNPIQVVWDENTSQTFNAFNAIVDESNGSVTYPLQPNDISVTRPLYYDDFIKENVTLTLLDENNDPIPENVLKLNYSCVNGVLAVHSLTYFPLKGDLEIYYKKGDIEKFKIHWRVEETSLISNFDPVEGNIENFDFHFTPIWYEKKVVAVGFSDTHTFDLPPGAWNKEIKSSSSHATGDSWFEVDGKLDDGEKVVVTLTNTGEAETDPAKLISKEITPKYVEADNKTYLDFDFGFITDDEKHPLNPEEDHEAKFNLSFSFTKGNFEHKQTGDDAITNTFVLEYTHPANGTITLDDASGLAGDTLITLKGKLISDDYKPSEFEKVELIAPTSDESNTMSLIEGGTKIKEDYSVETNVRLTVDNPSADHVFEGYTFKFWFTGHESDPSIEVKDVKVTYVGFSTDLDKYLQARTVPMVLFANPNPTYYYYDRYYFTAWVLSKYRPESVYGDDDYYKYYIVTTRQHKLAYDRFVTLHNSNHNLKLGLTDSTFASPYKNKSTGTQENVNGYIANYVYCNASAIQWLNDECLYDDTTKSACNIAIGIMDFNTTFSGWTEGGDYDRTNREKSYLNKLWQVNNYQQHYTNINVLQEQMEDPSTGYTSFAYGGFYSYQSSWKDLTWETTDGTYTVSKWESNNITANELKTQNASGKTFKYLSTYMTNDYYFDWGRLYKGDWECDLLDSEYSLGSPTYYWNKNQSSGSYDSYKTFAYYPMSGGMLVGRTSGTSDTPIKLLGIYIGWLPDKGTGSSTFTFTPYFDIFNNDVENFVEDYMED